MNTQTSNTSIHSRRGQTLVEAIIALSILTMGFLGITALLTKSFQLNRTTTDDTQATYLAAEGIELTKNIIDYDVYYGLSLGNDGWACSFPLAAGTPAHYEIDYSTVISGCGTPLATVSAAKAQSDPLYFNPSTLLYGYNTFGATRTNFTRDVEVTLPPATYPNEIDVRSTVTWTDAGLSNSITLEDVFYDWHP